MTIARLLWRELRFWGQSLLVCSFPLAFIWQFAGYLGFPNPFGQLEIGSNHAEPGKAQLGFLLLVAGFYLMRSTDRVAYGFAEMLFALIGFSFFYRKLAENYSDNAFLLTTGGFIYIAVRGLDNVVTGARRHYADPSTDPRWFW